ncbi:MAG: HNH endonuclease, partial [Cyclobacteriaceae bacterium]
EVIDGRFRFLVRKYRSGSREVIEVLEDINYEDAGVIKNGDIELVKNGNGDIEWRELANTGSKFKIITKLDGLGDLTHAKRFVNSLDETVDAALLNKLDELDGAPLRNLDDFYADLGRNTPSPYTNTDINFIATKSITVKGKKYVNGQVTDVSKTINVDLPYKHGFPEFHKTDYCPEITLANGSKGKYKYVDDNLDFSKYGDHFKDANRRLLDDMRLTNSTKNAEGFYQTGNYRWNGKTSDFELKNANDVWEKYTWHHYQDGKTMIPVLSHVHSTGLKGFKHAGGQSLSTKGILGIFEFLGF